MGPNSSRRSSKQDPPSCKNSHLVCASVRSMACYKGRSVRGETVAAKSQAKDEQLVPKLSKYIT